MIDPNQIIAEGIWVLIYLGLFVLGIYLGRLI